MGIYNRIFPGTPSGRLSLPTPRQDELQRTTLAIQALRAHVMVADQNNVIVALNPSVERMLRAAESDIRKELPAFSVERLLGSNMDVFHRNPGHQQRILAQLKAPHEAAVKIGGREFSLIATPLVSGTTRLGTVIEWQDLTETNALRAQEREQRAAERAKNDELAVITTALDSVSSNVMMADADGRIFFTNKSVQRLLKAAEADIRAVLPDFAADALIGRNFDVFHRNPAHQRNLLGRLTGPYEADIKVGVRRFRLTAAPVFGKDGARLATVVEWLDRTAELLMEQDVENTIQAAIHGELDARIDNRAYHGFLGKIAGGVNQLLDVFDGVLKDAGGALHAMARGDLCRKIDRDYLGRYAALKADVNATIERLQSVVRDIGSATAEVRNV